MVINANTKISGLLKESADALEAIISISPKFEKLRNPLLRKIMAGRTSIAMASKIGGCTIADFFNKLKPLGFEIDSSIAPVNNEKKQMPAFLNTIQKDQLTELDVRPVIAAGKDPLSLILQKIKWLKPGQVLKIINSFYPQPLILLLEKQGFESFADVINDDLVETYFYKKRDIAFSTAQQPVDAGEGWDDMVQRFKNRVQIVDVRQMAMPLPMMTILEALNQLPDEKALFVYHKRIPVFLLPELAERKFTYRIKEISDGQVNLLIFRN